MDRIEAIQGLLDALGIAGLGDLFVSAIEVNYEEVEDMVLTDDQHKRATFLKQRIIDSALELDKLLTDGVR